MRRGTLVPDVSEVKLICLRSRAGEIQVKLRACRPFSLCPVCGGRSSRVHSRYERTLADLPWEGVPVRLLLRAQVLLLERAVFATDLYRTAARNGGTLCTAKLPLK